MRNDTSDHLLKAWGDKMDSRLTPADDLKKNILNAVLCQPRPAVSAPRPIAAGFFRLWIPALGTLVLALVAAVCFYAGQFSNNVKPLIGLSEQDIAELKTVNREVQRLFPEGVSWVNKVGDAIDICPAIQKTSAGPTLMVRQVILRQVAGQWRQVYVADMLTRPDESIEAGTAPNKNYLWTHRLENGLYAVEGKTSLPEKNGPVTVEFSGGQQLNEPTLVTSVSTPSAEYRVYQTLVEI